MTDDRERKGVTITIDIDLLEKVDKFAEDSRLSRSTVINMLLAETLDEFIKRKRTIRMAVMPKTSFEDFLRQSPDAWMRYQSLSPEEQRKAKARWEGKETEE